LFVGKRLAYFNFIHFLAAWVNFEEPKKENVVSNPVQTKKRKKGGCWEKFPIWQVARANIRVSGY